MYVVYVEVPENNGTRIFKIYDDREPFNTPGRYGSFETSTGYGCINPQFEMEAGNAGAFTFTLVPNAYGYGTLKKMRTYVRIYRDDSILPGNINITRRDFGFSDGSNEIIFAASNGDRFGFSNGEVIEWSWGKPFWEGRIIEIGMRNDSSLVHKCEGALAYTNDIIMGWDKSKSNFETDPDDKEQQPIWNQVELKTLIGYFLAEFNSRVDDKRKIKLGDIEDIKYVEGDKSISYRLTIDGGYVNLWKHLQNITESFGGYFYISFNEYGEKFLCYNRLRYKNAPTVAQGVIFGENMLEFSATDNVENYRTAIIASSNDGLVKLNYVDSSPVAIGNEYYFETYNKFDEVDTEQQELKKESNNVLENLVIKAENAKITIYNELKKQKARELLLLISKDYLERIQKEGREMEIKALDLHLLDQSVPYINLLDKVLVKADIYKVTGNTLFLKRLSFTLSDVSSMVYTFILETEEL